MHSKITAVLWLSAIAIALVSTILTSNIDIVTNTSTFKLTLLERFYEEYGFVSYIFSSLTPPIINSGRYHQRTDAVLTCDESKWKSNLISDYDVKLVLTVDMKGRCANFSNIQEAVDAVPDSSNTRTLILIDSGTYRFSFVCICFCLCNVIKKMTFYCRIKYLMNWYILYMV